MNTQTKRIIATLIATPVGRDLIAQAKAENNSDALAGITLAGRVARNYPSFDLQSFLDKVEWTQVVQVPDVLAKIDFKGDGTGISTAWDALEELKQMGAASQVESGDFDNYGQSQPYTIFELPDGRTVQQIDATWSNEGFLRLP